MSTTTQIHVVEVSPPEFGKKKGKVIGKDGAVYYVWPDKLDRFAPGGLYEIAYDENEFNGRTLRNINTAKGIKILQSGNGAATRPVPTGGVGGVANVSNKDDDIATIALFKSLVEGGVLKPQSDAAIARALNLAWQGWLLHKKHRETWKMSAADEMNDEIPDWGPNE